MICKVDTDDNIADPLTKPLGKLKHEGHTRSMVNCFRCHQDRPSSSFVRSGSGRPSLSKSQVKKIRPSNCSPVPFPVACGEDLSESPGEDAAQIHRSAIPVRPSLFSVVCKEGLSDPPVEVAA
ncbi:unnamed protein product [Cuscuta campestris]|uniref:Uncharacterized protein n=1 Tax=Cuscuta campestris TaxID=132261 RepID=A0A484L240_9ASTE|nr:unnamed protein product [Cuscuta campestris]